MSHYYLTIVHPRTIGDLFLTQIIALLEKLIHSCDAYGIWGPRTQGGLPYSSRNLDYNKDTGINGYKLVIIFDIDDPAVGPSSSGGVYAGIGFSLGLGVLAGMNEQGITTSEMNLDNSKVTFNGMPFMLRLRHILERGTDLESAMKAWNATHNTNSFNFLIASAADARKFSSGGGSAAYALETIRDFTAVFGANSSVERSATFYCARNDSGCAKWTNQTGNVPIGRPLSDVVWRTNHGMDPRVMATQEPLFNDTVFRYNLMHDIFVSAAEEGALIDDAMAVRIVATLGTKGENFLTCNQQFTGDNVLSVAYAPGDRTDGNKAGRFFAAWESGAGASWRPAACSPFVRIDLDLWVHSTGENQ